MSITRTDREVHQGCWTLASPIARPGLRGHPVGLIVHNYGSHRKRNVLLGPIGQARGSPPDWLDGLDPDEAIETILQATRLLPPEDLEKALSAWDGLEVAHGLVPGRNAAGGAGPSAFAQPQ